MTYGIIEVSSKIVNHYINEQIDKHCDSLDIIDNPFADHAILQEMQENMAPLSDNNRKILETDRNRIHLILL